MNRNIQRLYDIAAKPQRLIIGLMSGTSLDGLDIALCSITGSGLNTKLELLQFESVAYEPEFKAAIMTVFSKQQIELEKLCLLHPWIALHHAQLINDCLHKWEIGKNEIDCIASHGQTIYHAPAMLHRQEHFGNSTLQIGDGDHLAVATGIITLSDFRQKHIAAGGEGAPLAVYGDYLVFSKKGEDRILLNIGGIANFTYLPGSMDVNAIFSTDVGPGNTLMDAWTRKNFPGEYFDRDAAIAKKGTTSEPLLAALKDHDFFNQPFPKTTGPELFNLEYLEKAIQRSATTGISIEDTMATLNQFSADMITTAIQKVVSTAGGSTIFASGGGMHNPLLMERLKKNLPGCSFDTTAALQIDPDAKEAVLFALLANEALAGDAALFGKGTRELPAVSMGKVSFPG